MSKKRSKKVQVIPVDTLVGSIDLGRFTHNGVFVTLTGDCEKPFKFSNNRSGFDEFYRRLLNAKVKFE